MKLSKTLPLKKIIIVFLALICSQRTFAKIETSNVTYKDKDTELEGYIAYDKNLKGPLPVVMVAHAWMGLDEYTKKRAQQLAGLGYLAFAVDIYGKGNRPKDVKEAQQLSGMYKNNRKLLRERINSAYDFIKSYKNSKKDEMGIIGYCFGGTVALELARSGANLKSVVTFHGGLETPTPEDAKNIKAKILVLHGAIDPFVTNDHVMAFQKEMESANIDWQLIKYGGAVHSFSDPGAGSDINKGAAYNEKADKRSWEAMKIFLKETL